MNLIFDISNVFVDFPETAARVLLTEFFLQWKLPKAFLPLAADLDNLLSEGFDEAKELIKSVVCIAYYQDRAFVVPVLWILYQHLDNLNSDVGLTCPWRPLDEREIVFQGMLHSR